MSIPKPVTLVDSGVEWLGPIPSHWSVRRVRFVAELNPSKSEVSSLAPNTEVSFLPMEAIGEDGSHQLDQVRLLSDVLTGYTFFKDGDVAIAKITPCFENGKGAVMRNLRNGIGFGTTELIVARPRAAATTSSFLHWLFSSHAFRQAGEAFMYGAGGQKRVPDDFVRNFATAFPPLPEQHQVVAFLDRETAKIDALVEEQKRLIELLKEKRQAVISQAVTKGLDPSVPMKDSGVAWLGEVPAHWEVAPIKSFGWLKGGAGFPHEEQGIQGEELDFFKVAALGGGRSGVIDRAEHTISRSTAARLGAHVFPEGTVVFAKVGAALLLGRVRVLSANSCIDNNMMGIVPHKGTDSEFLRLAMSLVRFDLIANPGAVPSLNESQIGNFHLAKPSFEEQQSIVTFAKAETAEIDSLTFEAQRGVDLLQERRSALISAAVTGKIDVRGLVPQPEVTSA